jgi:hypothetical protein
MNFAELGLVVFRRTPRGVGMPLVVSGAQASSVPTRRVAEIEGAKRVSAVPVRRRLRLAACA